MHLLGARAVETLFYYDNDETCQNAKRGFLTAPESLIYLDNAPLTQLIAEFSTACKTNFRVGNAEPSDPLTHEKVLDIFERALARESEWPTSGDEAIPYTIPDLDEILGQSGSRVESDVAHSRSSSGTPMSSEGSNDLPGGARRSGQALQSGSRRSLRLAHAAQVPSGSRSRKRSREAHETTNDAGSDDERTKRTKTNSERHAAEASGGRKQPKARRGRK